MKNGSPYPIGASVTATGVNFSVFSYHATRAELLLFDTEDATEPSRIIDLVSGTSRTSHYWQVRQRLAFGFVVVNHGYVRPFIFHGFLVSCWVSVNSARLNYAKIADAPLRRHLRVGLRMQYRPLDDS